MSINEIYFLTVKDFKLSFRSKTTFGSIIIYLFSTIFVSYLAFKSFISPEAWNAIFWIIILFTAINSASASFIQEDVICNTFYKFLAYNKSIFISKLIFNTLTLIIMSFIIYLTFILLIDNPIQNQQLFLITLLIGTAGISFLITFVSAISIKASDSLTLTAILSIPLVIPLITLCIQLTQKAINNTSTFSEIKYIISGILLDFLIALLGVFLYPFLSKE